MFHLWHLLKTMRESADSAYAGLTPLPAIARQILLILQRGWGQTFPDLCGLIGKDKAQISRALGRLEESGLVTRARARGPLALTAEGATLARQLMAMAERRNDRLLAGLDEQAAAAAHAITETLILRARALYDAERMLCGEGASPEGPRQWYDGGDADLPRQPEGGLILPRLIALLAYAQRSMALAAKRLVGMPAFDTLVLSFVAARAPLEQAALVAILSRDQSQAARTIRRLTADGLIVRLPSSGRRAILLAPTADGIRIDGVMAAEVARRDAFLAEAVPAARMAAYRAMFRRMDANAAALAGGPAA